MTSGRFVDLHMHSTASDGVLAPEAVVAAAQRAGLVAIALTDHDTLAGVAAAQAEGARLGVRVIAGVELSAHDGEKEVHLLGLHLSRGEVLAQRLEDFGSGRLRRAEEMVRKLNSLGVPVTMSAVLEQAGGGVVGRPHVARAILAGKWARDTRDVFDRFLGHGRPAYVSRERLPIGDAIRLIQEAGGLAVLAHPGPEGSRDRVERLAGLGLDGLEVRHPSHSAEDVARLGALVEHFRLVPSGGSDWHGSSNGPRTIGCMEVPIAWLERQEQRLAARATPMHAG